MDIAIGINHDDVCEHACRGRREEDEETRTARREMLRYIEFPQADGPFKAAVELFVLPHPARRGWGEEEEDLWVNYESECGWSDDLD